MYLKIIENIYLHFELLKVGRLTGILYKHINHSLLRI